MRKRLFLIIGISFVLFAGCKQFFADIEKDFEYWTSTVHVIDIVLPPVPEDIDGYPCVSSDDDKIVTLKLVNPQHYVLKTPADSGAPSKIVVFEDGVVGSSGAAPVHGIDYEFKQNGSSEAQLIYKKAFLEKSEWGRQNLSASITLYNKEGRNFGTHSFKLRANSRLPVPKGIALLKTKTPDSSGKRYYVLCFKPDNIDKRINNNTEFLHKDLSNIRIKKENDSARDFPLKFNADNSDFDISGASEVLIKLSDTKELESDETSHPDLIDPKPAGPWVICLKTDVPVAPNSDSKKYYVWLKDDKNVFSMSGIKATNTFKPPAPKISFSDDMNGVIESGIYTPVGKPEVSIGLLNGTYSGQADGLSEENAIPIYSAYGSDIHLKIKFYITSLATNDIFSIETLLTVGSEKFYSTINGNGSDVEGYVELKVLSEEAIYRLDTWVAISGLEDSDVFSRYYKVIKGVNGNTANDVPVWGILKKGVEKTDSGGSLIVRSEIKATGADDNKGEIEIDKALTIMGITGSGSDILNANYGTGSGQNNNKHRIFNVLNSGNLTIKGLTLKGADSGSQAGGAIYTSGTVNMIDCAITENKASEAQGGGVYVAGGLFTMSGNSKIDENNDVYLPTNKMINISGELTADGHAAMINPQSYPSGGTDIKVLDGDISNFENYKKFKVKDYGSTHWYVNSFGYLTTTAPAP